MKKNIAVLPGDGIGPEVVEQAIKVLKVIAIKYNHSFIFDYGLVGAAAIDKTGNPLPEETLTLCQESDAILFGAIGNPKYDLNPNAIIRPEQGLLKLRKTLGLFVNLRPVKIYKKLIDASPLKNEKVGDVDLIVVRDLTGGIYFGRHRRFELKDYYSSNKEVPSGTSELRSSRQDGYRTVTRQARTIIKAIDTSVYTSEEIIRIAKLAFEIALNRKKGIVSVDKANVLETSRLWRETVIEVSKKYPTVSLTHMFVDNAAMQIIKNPKQFDVILTENMFGDILSDEASVIAGSIGLLPSASIGNKYTLYEPIHGAFNKAAGQNRANPIGTILSVALMLRISFRLEKEALAVEKAVDNIIKDGFRTYDISDKNTPKVKILGTKEVGDKISENL